MSVTRSAKVRLPDGTEVSGEVLSGVDTVVADATSHLVEPLPADVAVLNEPVEQQQSNDRKGYDALAAEEQQASFIGQMQTTFPRRSKHAAERTVPAGATQIADLLLACQGGSLSGPLWLTVLPIRSLHAVIIPIEQVNRILC
jgi:hypothetical protein